MREILFRGKRVDNGEWAEGFLFQTQERTYIAYAEQFDDDLFLSPKNIFIEVIPETVGQYTGLTDKNGKKIFEGYILSVTVREFVRECGVRKFTGKTKQTVWSVEYAERRTQGNGFYVFGKDRRFSLGLTKSVIYNASPEIIGNIHDNPESLKGGVQE